MIKKISVALIVIFTITMYSFVTCAQTDNKLTLHQYGLQAVLGDNLSLKPFLGNSLSIVYKQNYLYTDRYGISVRHDKYTHYNMDTQHTNLELVYHRLKYLTPQYRVQTYYGYGPGFTYTYTKTNDTKDITGTIQVSGLIGSEYYFIPSISGFIEYRTTLDYIFDFEGNNSNDVVSLYSKFFAGITLYY